VYRGVPDAFAGIKLAWPVQTTDIVVADLPPATQARINQVVRASSLEEAYALVDQYRSEITTDTPGSILTTATPTP